MHPVDDASKSQIINYDEHHKDSDEDVIDGFDVDVDVDHEDYLLHLHQVDDDDEDDVDADDVFAVDQDHLVHLHQVESLPKSIFCHLLARVLHKLLAMNPYYDLYK